ncbi:hypothetical protein NP233_g1594 [Leucocoprinus birnbaumii]|uniref:Uncharacterized protein n=1 Tax=Leucocoprinus birnbaumii TaxID=56174 RepID=A0AAD5W0M1_9AGAR|nr:hypothetical protein NP233_g1594 [Leucocoprinus birnbaumii]
MLERPPPTTSPDNIKGNASNATRELLCNPAAFFQGRYERNVPPFGNDILTKAIVTEASIVSKREDELKKEAIVVIELEVTEGESSIILV